MASLGLPITNSMDQVGLIQTSSNNNQQLYHSSLQPFSHNCSIPNSHNSLQSKVMQTLKGIPTCMIKMVNILELKITFMITLKIILELDIIQKKEMMKRCSDELSKRVLHRHKERIQQGQDRFLAICQAEVYLYKALVYINKEGRMMMRMYQMR